MWGLMLGCVVMEPPEPIRDARYPVGGAVVREVITREPGIPDPQYVRAYTLLDGWWSTPLGSYSDEGSMALQPERPPYADGEQIIILSGAHALIHTRGEGTRDVSAWSAEGFAALGRNGHYDLRAESVELGEARWVVRFSPVAHAEEEGGVRLVSVDQGESWLLD